MKDPCHTGRRALQSAVTTNFQSFPFLSFPAQALRSQACQAGLGDYSNINCLAPHGGLPTNENRNSVIDYWNLEFGISLGVSWWGGKRTEEELSLPGRDLIQPDNFPPHPAGETGAETMAFTKGRSRPPPRLPGHAPLFLVYLSLNLSAKTDLGVTGLLLFLFPKWAC